jgi:hypothetical protein
MRREAHRIRTEIRDMKAETSKKQVCLITPGHVSSCPRIVKEADALAEAGFDVTVVSGRSFEPVVALDRVILSHARWSHREVPVNRGWLRRAARKGLQLMGPRKVSLALARLLTTPGLPALTAAAVETGADLYHAHCLGGLAAAADASRQTGTPFSFDMEDFHEEESSAVMSNPTERAAVVRIMQDHLPRAAFVTAASPLIAQACTQRYGVAVIPLLNAFVPLTGAVARRSGPFTEGNPAKLYWFSQTVGPGRGLEEIVEVGARMRVPCVLQLRGFVSESYRSALAMEAAKSGVRIEFLSPGPPDEMVALAAEADLGLSLERSFPTNRDICLTNKVFVYLAAGIPQLMSTTKAQSEFAREIGAAAVLMDLGDPSACASTLDDLLSNACSLAEARAQAVLMGDRYAWAGEKRKFLAAVQQAVCSDSIR